MLLRLMILVLLLALMKLWPVIMRSAAHNQHSCTLAVFWRVMGFDCHRILILMLDWHHVVTLALIWNGRCWTLEYMWQASAEQMFCLVCCGCGANVGIGGGSLLTGSSIELLLDWLLMTTHNGGVFLLDPGFGVVCCILREKWLECIMDCVCDGWDGWGGVLGVISSCKDIPSVKLSYLTYMLLNTCFYIALGFTG